MFSMKSRTQFRFDHRSVKLCWFRLCAAIMTKYEPHFWEQLTAAITVGDAFIKHGSQEKIFFMKNICNTFSFQAIEMGPTWSYINVR